MRVEEEREGETPIKGRTPQQQEREERERGGEREG